MRLLKEEFEHYFSDFSDTELPELKMTSNIFSEQKYFPEELQEEFLEMKCNSTAKKNFEIMSLTYFWAKYVNI